MSENSTVDTVGLILSRCLRFSSIILVSVLIVHFIVLPIFTTIKVDGKLFTASSDHELLLTTSEIDALTDTEKSYLFERGKPQLRGADQIRQYNLLALKGLQTFFPKAEIRSWTQSSTQLSMTLSLPAEAFSLTRFRSSLEELALHYHLSSPSVSLIESTAEEVLVNSTFQILP